MIRHPCDAQKSCNLRIISWKEEGFVIYDFRFGIYDFGLMIAEGIITDGEATDGTMAIVCRLLSNITARLSITSRQTGETNLLWKLVIQVNVGSRKFPFFIFSHVQELASVDVFFDIFTVIIVVANRIEYLSKTQIRQA